MKANDNFLHMVSSYPTILYSGVGNIGPSSGLDLPTAANLKVTDIVNLTTINQGVVSNRRPEAPTSVAQQIPEETAVGISVESHTIGYYTAHVHQIKMSETHRVRYVREPGVALLMQNILTYGWDKNSVITVVEDIKICEEHGFPPLDMTPGLSFRTGHFICCVVVDYKSYS